MRQGRPSRMLNDPAPQKAKRVMEAMLKVKKIEIGELQKAYDGATTGS